MGRLGVIGDRYLVVLVGVEVVVLVVVLVVGAFVVLVVMVVVVVVVVQQMVATIGMLGVIVTRVSVLFFLSD